MRRRITSAFCSLAKVKPGRLQKEPRLWIVSTKRIEPWRATT
jgi:hypothetical protein